MQAIVCVECCEGNSLQAGSYIEINPFDPASSLLEILPHEVGSSDEGTLFGNSLFLEVFGGTEVGVEFGLLALVADFFHPGEEGVAELFLGRGVFGIVGEVVPFVVVVVDGVQFFGGAVVVAADFFGGVGIGFGFAFPRIEYLGFAPFGVFGDGDDVFEFHFGREIPDVFVFQ